MGKYPVNVKTVYYFGTCLIDMAYPGAGMAGIKLLEREGVEVLFPPDQTCCGQPAYNSGFPDEARAVARKQMEIFSKKPYPVIVPSGSCAGMMKHHYPELFRGYRDFPKVSDFAGRVFELTEFLAHSLSARYVDKGPPVRLTWHSSCHALREMACIESSKSLIRQLSNVTLVELEKEWECCGFGGTFAVKQPEISGAMVQDKVRDIESTKTPLFLTGDCGCLMNITGRMEKEKSPVKGMHIAEFILERING